MSPEDPANSPPRPAGRGLRLGAWVTIGLVAAGAAAVLLKGGPIEARTRAFTRVLHAVALEPDLWEVASSGAGGMPASGVLTPSLGAEASGGDAPALILPPPSSIRFVVPDDGSRVQLAGRTGVDLSAPDALPADVAGVEVSLAVDVDGEKVWENRHQIRRRGKRQRDELLWKELPEIALEPGQVVTLSSKVRRPDHLQSLPRLELGFGDLELVQSGEKRLSTASPDRPNVLLIVMDTLRQDRLSCYGYELPTTPSLDRLAQRGILYENAYATASWTWPSTASILTGRSPAAHGVVSPNRCTLAPSLETLPELLSERGLVTGAITCNPLIVPDKEFDQGFDYFDSSQRFRQTEAVMGAALDWMRLNASSRFFLYIQFVDTHEAYHPTRAALAQVGGEPPADYPEKGMEAYHQRLLAGEGHDEQGNSALERLVPASHQEWMGRAYDAAVISADTFVGRLLEELAELGLEDRTIVAFTSDHGEELGEHGLLTHGHTLYPEVMRIPLILAGPGLPRGERVETPVSNRHLAPSLAALANASFDQLDDSLDLLRPDQLREAPVFFSTSRGWWNGHRNVLIHGVRHVDWELPLAPRGAAWGAEEPSKEGEHRLYHLPSDPQLHSDVSIEERTRASELRALLEAHMEREKQTAPDTSIGAGKRSLEALVGIGYIGTDESVGGE